MATFEDAAELLNGFHREALFVYVEQLWRQAEALLLAADNSGLHRDALYQRASLLWGTLLEKALNCTYIQFY